jgi:hypothetical protein
LEILWSSSGNFAGPVLPLLAMVFSGAVESLDAPSSRGEAPTWPA